MCLCVCSVSQKCQWQYVCVCIGTLIRFFARTTGTELFLLTLHRWSQWTSATYHRLSHRNTRTHHTHSARASARTHIYYIYIYISKQHITIGSATMNVCVCVGWMRVFAVFSCARACTLLMYPPVAYPPSAHTDIHISKRKHKQYFFIYSIFILHFGGLAGKRDSLSKNSWFVTFDVRRCDVHFLVWYCLIIRRQAAFVWCADCCVVAFYAVLMMIDIDSIVETSALNV